MPFEIVSGIEDERGRLITFFIMPGNRHVRREEEGEEGRKGLTCFPFGERYMTSRFILNKFDLDLSPSCFLVRLGLLVVIVVLSSTVDRVVIVDKRVITNWGGGGTRWSRMTICGRRSGRMHVEGALAFTHSWGRRGLGGRGLRRNHSLIRRGQKRKQRGSRNEYGRVCLLSASGWGSE